MTQEEIIVDTSYLIENLDDALDDGYTLECDLVGMGVRRAVIKSRMTGIVAAGQTSNIDNSLVDAGRIYRTRETEYDDSPLHPAYFDNCANPSQLEIFVGSGGLVRAAKERDTITVTLGGSENMPEGVEEMMKQAEGSEMSRYIADEERGILYKLTAGQYESGETFSTMNVIDNARGLDPWHRYYVQKGTGSCFAEALARAFNDEKSERLLAVDGNGMQTLLEG